MKLNALKNSTALRVLILALILNSNVWSGTCGIGHITKILEGGWNTDDLRIKINYISARGEHIGTEDNGFITYKSTFLSPQRLSAIRALALAAYMSGKEVVPYSHNNSCANSTELSFKD